MKPSVRARALLSLLLPQRPGELALCRDVEARCHAVAGSAVEYETAILRAACNLRANPRLGSAEVVHAPDWALTSGTILERIHEEAASRKARFEQMLQEKYESLSSGNQNAVIRCNRCGSSEVTWEEKQTRSADESGSVFCACATCKKVWVLR